MATQQDGTLSSTEVDLPHPKRRRSFLLCEHCDRYVSNSTYYRHKEAYFNRVTGQWQQGDDTESVLGSGPESEDLESLGNGGNHYEGTRIFSTVIIISSNNNNNYYY